MRIKKTQQTFGDSIKGILSKQFIKRKKPWEKKFVWLDLEFSCREFRLKLDKFTLLQQNHFADLRKAIETRREYLTLKIEHNAQKSGSDVGEL